MYWICKFMKNKRIVRLFLALIFASFNGLYIWGQSNESCILHDIFYGEDIKAVMCFNGKRNIEIYSPKYREWNALCETNEMLFTDNQKCDIKLLLFDKIGNIYLVEVEVNNKLIKYLFRQKGDNVTKYKSYIVP